MNSSRGVALLLAIIVMSFLTAIGLGLALIVMIDRLATGNLRGSVAMLHAADAALELAAHDLLRLEDWNEALTGAARSVFADGEPSGARSIPGGGAVDLTATTNHLNCGRSAGCSAADMDANTTDRPWGANNARWRLYAYGPLGNIVQFSRPADCYLAVWVADDGLEEDGDPSADAPEAAPGHDVLRIRAEAYGPAGMRRAIEAEVERRCLDAAPAGCRQGIRVHSWKEVRIAVP
jgi:hypothetical protein